MSKTTLTMYDQAEEALLPVATVQREVWLHLASRRIADRIKASGVGAFNPRLRISVGFPSRGGTGSRSKVIGQCHYASSDKFLNVFIHPELDDPVQVLATLAHEMAHAALPPGTGHKGAFVNLVRALLLIGPPTATEASEEFAQEIAQPILDALPPYPHRALKVKPKTQSTRTYKVVCYDDDYILRATRKQLAVAVPACPVCDIPMWLEDHDGKLTEHLDEHAGGYEYITFPL